MMGLEQIKEYGDNPKQRIWDRMSDADRQSHPSLNPNPEPPESLADAPASMKFHLNRGKKSGRRG